MKSERDLQLANIRQTIIFGGAAIPAAGSWLLAYNVLEAFNPRVAYGLIILASVSATLLGASKIRGKN